MEWCKLYASLRHDRDLRRAGEAATLLFVFGLCYCADEETDGYIADDALPDFKLSRVKFRADALVRHGLWERVSDGYTVPNWKPKQRELYVLMAKRRRDADRMARKRKESRDGSSESRATVARRVAEKSPPQSREEENPPDPPAPQGGTRCTVHKRPRRGCADCAMPPLAPVPDWCGECSPTRRVEHPDTGLDLGPCPRCHPSVRAS